MDAGFDDLPCHFNLLLIFRFGDSEGTVRKSNDK